MAEGLFEKIYSAGKEALDAMKKPFVKSALKRKFHSAYDDAEVKKMDATTKVGTLREELIKSGDKDNNKINEILQAKKSAETLQQMQDILKDEYKEIFAEDLKTRED